ncbi:MAG TPA: hypothetical protein VF320_07560 [Acidimicrobiales bacterium]
MGIFLVIGMMVYSVGLCRLLQRFGQRQPGARALESQWNHPSGPMVVPDRVPAEWVDAYRAEQGG